MIAQANRPMAVEEWRALERSSHDAKHEYIDGWVYAMAGGSLDHATIGFNAVQSLKAALGRGPCRAYPSDAAARLSASRYTYPDATVTCDEGDHGRVTEVQAPRVIVEVLSESTEAYDRGDKFGYYRECPTIHEYVLVATRYQTVEVYRRTAEEWTAYSIYKPGDTIALDSISVQVPVSAFYLDTDVPEWPIMRDGAV